MDSIFHALADETRRAIVEFLISYPNRSLFEICVTLDQKGIGMTRQGISRHLSVLQEADIVRVRKQGRTNIHWVNTEAIEAIYSEWMKNLFEKE